MKKFFKIISIVVLCILSFIICVYAHSGKTDSSGGHYNHSTGEYHYHHGYSAHQHYDMDGDGVKDCPYKFKDNTNYNNSSSNSSSNSSTTTSSGSQSTTYEIAKKVTLSDIFISLFQIVFYSAMGALVGFSSGCFFIVNMIIMIPIRALVKKFCNEKSRDSIIDRCELIVFWTIAVIMVIIISILVLNNI